MKILITEKIADEGISLIKDAGIETDIKLGLSHEELIQTISEYNGLIIRSSTIVDYDVLEAAKNLTIVGRAGIGVDNIDVDAATAKGIIVCNAPTSNTMSAAEHTMAMMLAVTRKIPQAAASMQENKWERSNFVGNELLGKTLAIVGLGRIGGLVAERAKSFGMQLIGYDPYSSEKRAESLGIKYFTDLKKMIPQADYITVHLPKTKETIGMFGKEEFALMKDSAYLINTARGGIYEVEALSQAVKDGKIAGAAIDVYESEPATNTPLHGVENIILTPHLGASTQEAQKRAGTQIAEYVVLGLTGDIVPTALNVTQTPKGMLEAVSPYLGACQTAGSILTQLADGAITDLRVTAFGELARLEIEILGTAALRPIIAKASDDPINYVNAKFIAEQRGVKLHLDKDEASKDFPSSILLRAKTETGGVFTVGCTVTGVHNDVRVINIQDYKLDLHPSKYVLILHYDDGPGRLGKICSILGDANINISTMQVSVDCEDVEELKKRKPEDGKAIVWLNVDEPVTDEILAKFPKIFDVSNLWYVQL